jgi:hypothetical protein
MVYEFNTLLAWLGGLGIGATIGVLISTWLMRDEA